MNEGLVKCCGTPLFLKRIFGAGYHLRISKNNQFDSAGVLRMIQNYIPNAQLKSEINTEVIYSLEYENSGESLNVNSNAVFAHLFNELEKGGRSLGINSCGLTVTTMEDVFLRVGNECNDSEKFNKNNGNSMRNGARDYIINDKIIKNNGMMLVIQQFNALLLKRFHYARRYWHMIVLQTVLPALLFMCILLIDHSLKKSIGKGMTSRELSLNMYGSSKGFFQTNATDLPKLSETYISFAKKESMNTELLTSNYEFLLMN